MSLLEACLALAESAAPEYSLTGYVGGPQGTGLRGIAPSNTFRSGDGHWVVISADQDTVFVRLCAAMGQPELTYDARFATHAARAENQEEIERIVADWASQRPVAEIDDILARAGVVCGPILGGMSDIFDNPYVRDQALVPHTDPDLGEYLAPEVTPRLSETPARFGGQEHGNPGRITLRFTANSASTHVPLTACARTGSWDHDLRRGGPRRPAERSGHAPTRRARRAGRPDRSVQRAARRSGELRPPPRIPQMAGAEETVAALQRRS